MQSYFTGGLYLFMGLTGIFFVGREYLVDNNLRVLDACLSSALFLIGAGFSVHTWFSIKKRGKENFAEARGCFLPARKK